jgi:hypothetical protein
VNIRAHLSSSVAISLCRSLALIGICALAAQAQQFTWEGEVSGIIVLHVHGKKVDIEYRDGPPVQRAQFHFVSPLPESRQNVRLEVRESRGAVFLTQQPGLNSEYSVDVTIEDRQDGAAFYSIALYWNSSAKPPPGRVDRVRWSGTMQGEVLVECRSAQCSSRAVRGQPVGRERFKFSHPLPEAEVTVMLDETNGPVDVRIVEQPSDRNGYTARLAVRSLLGAATCSFVLVWERPAAK